MAAQLGQGFQAKDPEDGARIGAAVSEIETVEDHGHTAAEDPTARELAQRQDAMALQMQGLAAQMTAMMTAISAVAGVVAKEEKSSATGAPNANELEHGPDPAAPLQTQSDPQQPLVTANQNTLTAAGGFAGHRISTAARHKCTLYLPVRRQRYRLRRIHNSARRAPSYLVATRTTQVVFACVRSSP